MANDDLKKINRGTISLREIKELLEIVDNKVGKLETHVSIHSATMHLIKDQQSVMNGKLDNLQEDMEEVKETLGNHGGALVRIESRLDGFADAWKINRAEINKVKRHLGLPSISE